MATFTQDIDILEKTIVDLQEDAKNGKLTAENQKTRLDDLEAKFRGLQQAQMAAHRPSEPSGPESELDMYVVDANAYARDIKSAQDHVFAGSKTSSTVLRLATFKDKDGIVKPGFLDDEPRHESQAEIQELVTERNLIRMWQRMGGEKPHTPTMDWKIERAIARAPKAISKIFADAAGIGADWVPDQYLTTLERDVELTPRIAQIFEQVNVPPGGTLHIPFQTNGNVPYIRSVPTADDPNKYTASTPGSTKRSYDTAELAVRQQIHGSTSEDMFIATLNIGRENLLKSIIDGIDDVIFNGDENGTHQDDVANWDIRSRWTGATLGTTADHRRMSTGLRARCLDNGAAGSTDQNAAQTAAGFRTARAKLATAHAMGDVVAIVSPEYFLTQMLGFADFATWDKVGPNATILTGRFGMDSGPLPGQVGFLFDIPVCVSWFLSADLNASGLYDNLGGTQTSMIMVNRARFKRFVRQGSRIEVGRDVPRGVTDVVATYRWYFGTLDAAATINAHLSYNLDSV